MRLRFAYGYQIFMHVLLVALAATVLALVAENRTLRHDLPAPSTAAPTAGLSAGDSMVAVSGQDLEGRAGEMTFTSGDREHLLFVFTTVCPACRENQSRWRELYERVGERVQITGISLNEVTATSEYKQAHDLPYPIFVAEDARSFATANKIDRVPFTVLLGKNGRVQETWLGALSDETQRRLQSLN